LPPKWRDPRISLLPLFSPQTCNNPGMVEQAYVTSSPAASSISTSVSHEVEVRVRQHKNHTFPNSFTARYQIDKLVYYECYALVIEAIAREKQLKRWSRIKKLRLIVAHNPTWRNLSADWGKPITPFDDPSSASHRVLIPQSSHPQRTPRAHANHTQIV